MAMDKTPKEGAGVSGIDLEAPASSLAGAPSASIQKPGGKGAKTLVTTIVIIIVLVVAGWLVNQYTSISLFGADTGPESSAGTSDYNAEDYYAVFLTNGQVYFGRITSSSESATILEDIYYLQVSNPLQQVPPPGTQQQPQLSLVKLGNELHGPHDLMRINNRHILFTEELKTGGRVVEAILNYKEGGGAAAAQ